MKNTEQTLQDATTFMSNLAGDWALDTTFMTELQCWETEFDGKYCSVTVDATTDRAKFTGFYESLATGNGDEKTFNCIEDAVSFCL